MGKKKYQIILGFLVVVSFGIGGLAGFIIIQSKKVHEQYPEQNHDLIKACSYAVRPAILSNELGFNTTYTSNYYGTQKTNFHGHDITINKLWDTFFSMDSMSDIFQKQQKKYSHINLHGKKQPSDGTFNEISSYTSYLQTLLSSGLTSTTMGLIGSIIKKNSSSFKNLDQTKFLSTSFLKNLSQGFNNFFLNSKGQLETYDQIWQERFPVWIYNFLVHSINKNVAQKSEPSFLFPLKELPKPHWSDPQNHPQVDNLCKILIDAFTGHKEYLYDFSDLITQPSNINICLQFGWFMLAYLHEYLYYQGTSPEQYFQNDRHLFSSQQTNNQVHQIIDQKLFDNKNINLQYIGELCDILLSADLKKNPQPWKIKLKIINALLYAGQSNKPFPDDTSAGHSSLDKVIGKLSNPIKSDLHLKWENIISKISDPKQVHFGGINSLWKKFTTPLLVQLICHLSNLKKTISFEKDVWFSKIKANINTWPALTAVVQQLHPASLITQLCSVVAANKVYTATPDISPISWGVVEKRWQNLLTDFINFINKAKVGITGLSLKLSQLVPSIKGVVKQIKKIKKTTHELLQTLTNQPIIRWLYQKYLVPILTEKRFDFTDNSILYFANKKQSLADWGAYLKQLMLTKSNQQTSSIAPVLQKMLQQAAAQPDFKKHPQVYDGFRHDLNNIQYALKLIWSESQYFHTKKKYGVDGALILLGLNQGKFEFEKNSFLEQLQKLVNEHDLIKNILLILNHFFKDSLQGQTDNDQKHYQPYLQEENFTNNNAQIKVNQKKERILAFDTSYQYGKKVVKYHFEFIITKQQTIEPYRGWKIIN